MTDTPIRTHTTTLDQEDIERGLVPGNWGPGTQVLVVAGLPEGAELRRLCDVPEGWEWQNDAGNWHPARRFGAEDECTGYVLCRPLPVPDPPATEKVLCDHNAVGRRLAENGQEIWSTGEDRYGPRWFRILSLAGNRMFASFDADDDGMVEVLVDPAPTGDDEPRADTPAPQGRWTVTSGGILEYGDIRLHHNDGDDMTPAAWAALVDLVRRDGTDPTPEAVYDELRRSGAHLAAGTIPLNVIGHVLDAVRALRAGETR